MTQIQQALAKIVDNQNLSQEEACQVMDQIMSGAATEAQIGAYITALRMKGETVDEIAGSAQAMRDKSTKIAAQGTVVDTCGTGGDSSGSFNISTTTAFVVAACGITVAKHGNRSISSKSGSADVLKALGVNIEAELAVVEKCLEKAGIGFMFAPRHHGAMKYAMGPRTQLALRTVFNLLGPLTNPASAPYQLLGVFSPDWTEPLAKVLGRIGSKRAMVVHGHDGLDEITLTDTTRVSELHEDGSVTTYDLDPREYGLQLTSADALKGGDAETNAAITKRILNNEAGPMRDIVVLNAGAAVYVSGMADTLKTGIDMAHIALESGRAMQRLEQLIHFSNLAVDDL
ncbi:MAG: anthranilate phosphoribosyltransferase [Magnetococcales bacterium]|nr:anthranilate phosphoribosyltransferase [Magnetococcales bacterium]